MSSWLKKAAKQGRYTQANPLGNIAAMANHSEFTVNPIRILNWIYRLIANKETRSFLAKNDLALAAIYSIGRNAFFWPAHVEEAVQAESEVQRSLSDSVKLLNTLGASAGGRLSLSQLKAILEGYAAARACNGNLEFLVHTAEVALSGGAINPIRENEHSSRRIRELQKLLDLSELQVDLIHLARIQGAVEEFAILSEELSRSRVRNAIATMVGATPVMLSKALHPTSKIAQLQMLEHKNEFGSKRVFLNEFWADLIDAEDPLIELLLEPLESQTGTGMMASLSPEDELTAHEILIKAAGTARKGVNLMVYGAANLDKQKALYRALHLNGSNELRAYNLKSREIVSEHLAKAMMLAQEVLHAQSKANDEKPVLVVDNVGDILKSSTSYNSILSFFGLPSAQSSEELSPLDKVLLTENKVVTIWIAANPSDMNPEVVSRFFFHCPVRKATRLERETQLHSMVDQLKLKDEQRKELVGFEGLSEAQLQTAIAVAKLTAGRKSSLFFEHMMQALKRSRQALSRQKQKGMKQSVTQYSLDLINYSGRFGPQSILKALSQKPQGTLALYGIPGTGKTQFAEYLAQVLGKPLIAKRGSDLLDKYVGETEKLINEMFEQAETEEAVLFLDEGDSFLRSRDGAQASWEVSRTNELLQKMERFEGIFILSTNLIDSIDQAALRRFTFKLEFKPLTQAQRYKMFVNEALGGIEPTEQAMAEAYQEALAFLRNLAAGDFATVKRQCVLLNETLTPEQWLEQLAIEVNMKNRDLIKSANRPSNF